MAKQSTSFLDRVHPNRMRSKLISWPFQPVEDAPKVRVRVLGAHELEAANLAAHDHFRKIKEKVVTTDNAFIAREHVELVWIAFRDDEDQTLTASAADLAKEPAEFIEPLYAEWCAFQNEVASPRLKQSDLDELIVELKKNTHADLLAALPSIWLRQLFTTLVSQPPASTTESAPG